MGLPKEKVGVGFLVQVGQLENGRVKAMYLNPEQHARAQNAIYNPDVTTKLPDVISARVQKVYDLNP